jgi:hypothetical protein
VGGCFVVLGKGWGLDLAVRLNRGCGVSGVEHSLFEARWEGKVSWALRCRGSAGAMK